MFEGNVVELKMEKVLLEHAEMDMKRYRADAIRYDDSNESVYLKLVEGDLTDLSLDAVYECQLFMEEGTVLWSGIITQRYCSLAGKEFYMRIISGFFNQLQEDKYVTIK